MQLIPHKRMQSKAFLQPAAWCENLRWWCQRRTIQHEEVLPEAFISITDFALCIHASGVWMSGAKFWFMMKWRAFPLCRLTDLVHSADPPHRTKTFD
eukprot:4367746-Amphidinium_carterae.1